jgi:hypothetical protein
MSKEPLYPHIPKSKQRYIPTTQEILHPPNFLEPGAAARLLQKLYQNYDVEIVDHGPHHKLVKIIKGGRVYAATYAEPFPTRESAIRDYLNKPKDFLPYNETTGRYL